MARTTKLIRISNEAARALGLLKRDADETMRQVVDRILEQQQDSARRKRASKRGRRGASR